MEVSQLLPFSKFKSQASLARELDLSEGHLSRLMTGKSKLSSEQAIRIMRVLDISDEDFFSIWHEKEISSLSRFPYQENFKFENRYLVINLLEILNDELEELILRNLNIEKRRFRFILSGRGKFPYLEAVKLCKLLELDFLLLHSSFFDARTFLKNMSAFSKSFHLPRRYATGATSEMRIFKKMVNNFEDIYGNETSEKVLNHLQLSRLTTRYLDRKISILSFFDFHQMSTKIVNDRLLPLKLGLKTEFSGPRISTWEKLKSMKSPEEILDQYLGSRVSRVEKNFDFPIHSLKDNQLVLRLRKEEAVIDQLDGFQYLNENVAMFCWGHITSFLDSYWSSAVSIDPNSFKKDGNDYLLGINFHTFKVH